MGFNVSKERAAELFARLTNDRFSDDGNEPDAKCRRCWNASNDNAARIVKQWLAEERIGAGLTELEEQTR